MTRGQVVGLAAGAPFAAVGVAALLQHADATHPARAAAWIVGAAVAHDFALAPLVFAVGALVRRAPLGRARVWVVTGLVVSGVVGLWSWPFVRGYGRLANNPSVLPRNYGVGLAATFVAVWTAVLVTTLVARRGGTGPAESRADGRRPG
jgi:hypothetical protein